ncbi:restriction endonuclease [Paenarthrobacter ureafaciens]|uniref:EcoAI/FtnUII family type I restriction enzme subunit R n=2 Tax=Paenarthrobacter ureafaciens TaxID=37931 RepID=UPI0015BBB360|nr:restriction endonuclease [Paenarthrobacter ureafaciens]
MSDKRSMSETDIRTKFITPAIVQAGWDLHTQIREEVTFTKGRIQVRGQLFSRGEAKRVDYLLSYRRNLPLAIVEAKDNRKHLGAGIQQALGYADALDVPFVFSSNGDGFLFHDRTGTGEQRETILSLDEFPSPGELWSRYCLHKGLDFEQQQPVETPYFDDGSGKTPRYYQVNAVNRAVECVARGDKRLLLVMATGTGKTYTAFQIIWRLWKANQAKRILFLTDRNILVDQTKNNDFKPFGGAMTKITKRKIDKSYEIYLSLYQAVSGAEDVHNVYKQFSPDFFDLIVVDECHRGSASANSPWREILQYFSNATQIGLTATPKETRDVSSSLYFGDPIYSYTLRQGIDDGFLAPYKVIRIDLDRDLQGWRPPKGFTDSTGVEIEDRIYNLKDMDRSLIVSARTELVAQKVTEYLTKTGPYQKTIVFCDDVDHAERMRRALVNLNPLRVSENRKYVMRITGDDEDGKRELDNFIDPEQRFPVIATTSKLMSTGVDAQTCKLIVLDQHIQSMTEFKQIIGRGTRVNEEYDKYWFAIMDFKRATELFADPSFDGDPVRVYEPRPGEEVSPPEDVSSEDSQLSTLVLGRQDEPATGRRARYVVDDLTVSVVAERVQYYGPDGRLITESLRDYTKARVGEKFVSLDDFIRNWTASDKKTVIIEELARHGVLWEALAEEVTAKVGDQLDPFDLILHVAFGQPPVSRRERAAKLKKSNYFEKYKGTAREVLEALVDKYAETGIVNVEDARVLHLKPFSDIGSPVELLRSFGGRRAYDDALHVLEQHLYA